MIVKWYEISCDYCKCGQHFQGTIQIAEQQFRDYGGVVTISGKHYCSRECHTKSKRPKTKRE